jgi:predicted peptidase
MRAPLLLLTLVLAFTMATKKTSAQPAGQSVQKLDVKITRTVTTHFLLALPKDYDAKAAKRWPLMMFLHGAGERGADLSKVAIHGPPKLVAAGQELPFIIVSPQCPGGERWSDDTLLALLDSVSTQHHVDTNRIYLTGLSMGGFASWSLAAKYPERFAAVAPICGGGSTIDLLLTSKTKRDAIKTLPIWAFHGTKDTAVPLAESEKMVAGFKRAGCQQAELTVYPDAGHDSWTETYSNPKLYEWFLSHTRAVAK